jgi:hypothetical protein
VKRRLILPLFRQVDFIRRKPDGNVTGVTFFGIRPRSEAIGASPPVRTQCERDCDAHESDYPATATEVRDVRAAGAAALPTVVRVIAITATGYIAG